MIDASKPLQYNAPESNSIKMKINKTHDKINNFKISVYLTKKKVMSTQR